VDQAALGLQARDGAIDRAWVERLAAGRHDGDADLLGDHCLRITV
jgi:hypothetical protein